jgi:hypothetical protein
MDFQLGWGEKFVLSFSKPFEQQSVRNPVRRWEDVAKRNIWGSLYEDKNGCN